MRVAPEPRQMAIFPDDREPPAALDCDVVQVRLSELELHHPRQWGACWLAMELWQQLELDTFWAPRLPVNRQGTRWLNVFKTLVAYQLIEPGSEWRLHRHWYRHSAMGDLLGEGEGCWFRSSRCIAAWTSCSSISKRCSRSCANAGRACSMLASKCCCMT